MPTKKEVKKWSKDLTLAIDWAATEYKFLEKLKAELKLIKDEKGINREIKDLRKASKILNYIGKAERRAFYFEEKVGKDLDKLAKEFEIHTGENFDLAHIIKGLREVLKELNVEESDLIKYTSRFDGYLRKGLDNATTQDNLARKIRKDKPKDAERIHENVLQIIQNVSEQTYHTEKWIRAIEATLKKAKAIVNEPISQKMEPIKDVIKRSIAMFKRAAKEHRKDYPFVALDTVYQAYERSPLAMRRSHSVSKDEFKENVLFDGGLYTLVGYATKIWFKYNPGELSKNEVKAIGIIFDDAIRLYQENTQMKADGVNQRKLKFGLPKSSSRKVLKLIIDDFEKKERDIKDNFKKQIHEDIMKNEGKDLFTATKKSLREMEEALKSLKKGLSESAKRLESAIFFTEKGREGFWEEREKRYPNKKIRSETGNPATYLLLVPGAMIEAIGSRGDGIISSSEIFSSIFEEEPELVVPYKKASDSIPKELENMCRWYFGRGSYSIIKKALDKLNSK